MEEPEGKGKQKGEESPAKGRGRGFRLRSQVSRQYRTLKGLVRKARKENKEVPRKVYKEIKEFGEGRTEQEKAELPKKRRPRSVYRREASAAASSGSRPGIRLRSVASTDPVVLKAARPRKLTLRSATRRTAVRSAPQADKGLKVHGRALKLNQRICDLAEAYAKDRKTNPYFLESPYQVRLLAAQQLKSTLKVRGSVLQQCIKDLWNLPNKGETKKGPDEACSSCDDRRVQQAPGVEEFLERRKAERLAKAKAEAAKAEAKPSS